MWTKPISRQEFITLVGSLERNEEIPFIPDKGVRDSFDSELCAIWFGDSFPKTEYPHVLLTERERMSGFFAYTSTFLPAIRPITSYIRLLSADVFKNCIQSQPISDPTWIDLCVAIIIAEVISELRSRDGFEGIWTNTFSSAYSFVMARTLTLYREPELWEKVSQDWLLLREWSNQSQRRTNITGLSSLWKLLMSIQSGSPSRGLSPTEFNLRENLLSLFQRDQLSPQGWDVLAGHLIPFDVVTDHLKAPREDRLRFVENAITEILTRTRRPEVDDFLLGFLVNVISDGTFDHADILFPILDEYPMALMYYGLFIGLTRSGKADSWRVGLRKRLTRELLRTPFLHQRPTADVSIDEFEVLNRPNVLRNNPILQTSQKTLSVELLPGVEQLIVWPNRSAEADRQTQKVESSPPPWLSTVQSAIGLLQGLVPPEPASDSPTLPKALPKVKNNDLHSKRKRKRK